MTGGPSIGNAGPGIADIDRGLGMGVGVPGNLGKHGSGLGEVGSLIGDSLFKRRTASEMVSFDSHSIQCVYSFPSSSVSNHPPPMLLFEVGLTLMLPFR